MSQTSPNPCSGRSVEKFHAAARQNGHLENNFVAFGGGEELYLAAYFAGAIA
jgi:hypothetical protein